MNELTMGSKASPVVVVPESHPAAVVSVMREASDVIAVVAESRATPAAVERLENHAASGNLFGLEQIVGKDTNIYVAHVRSYDDKLDFIRELEQFAELRGIRAKYREAISQCADEVIMNALYVAPREAASSKAGTNLSKAEIVARARRGAEVQYAYANKTLYLAVRDTYGSLERGAIVRHLGHAIDSHGQADADADHGLGLYIITNSSTSVRFNEASGIATECICTFDTTAPKVHLEEFSFLTETNDDALAQLESWAAQSAVIATHTAPVLSRRVVILGVLAAVAVLLVVLVLALR